MPPIASILSFPATLSALALALAAALDAAPTEALEDERSLKATAKTPSSGAPSPAALDAETVPHNYLIAIGVNDYADKRLPRLRFCENDAIKVREYFVQSGLVDDERAYLLTCSNPDRALQPTRANIRQKLNHAVAHAGAQSLIVFYVASHGVAGPGEGRYLKGYFVASDSNLDDLQETAMDLAAIHGQLRDSHAGRTLMIVDACRTVVHDTRAAVDLSQGNLFEQIQKTQGHFFMASCSDAQVSYEMRDSAHGAFTYFLLHGLGGKAANADGRVTLEGLYTFVKDSLRDWGDRETRQVMAPFINVERWSGDPLVLAFAPVMVSLMPAATPPAPAPPVMTPAAPAITPAFETTANIDRPVNDGVMVRSVEELDRFIAESNSIEGYNGAKRYWLDAKTRLPPGDPERDRAFWLWSAALILASEIGDNLAVEADYKAYIKDRSGQFQTRLKSPASAQDATTAREILGHYAQGGRFQKVFSSYLKSLPALPTP